ncbi:uncharacterized protein LOC143021132 [Oratosquilla oratoria]|uniref:uncharacterized protein LOC143021132 n=1 Tax=Oratosquilla oratoria TaxID=337810 RepID=UPI003F773EE2
MNEVKYENEYEYEYENEYESEYEYEYENDASVLLNTVSASSLLTTAAVLSVAQAQFIFPRLPTPPRIFFGGFRPIFNRRPPPRRPRPFLVPANQFLQQQQLEEQNLIVPPPFFRPEPLPPRPTIITQPPSPPPPPPTFQRPQSTQPPPPPPPPPPSRPPVPPTRPVSRPRPPVTNFIPESTFGSPRPDDVIFGQRPGPVVVGPTTVVSTGGFGPNIIGMKPPPPPPPPPPRQITRAPTRPAPPPPPTRPPVILTTAPVRPPPPPAPVVVFSSPAAITPPSNSLDELVVNPVPSVNAGVLPLANEKPSELQLFPPLNRPVSQ